MRASIVSQGVGEMLALGVVEGRRLGQVVEVVDSCGEWGLSAPGGIRGRLPTVAGGPAGGCYAVQFSSVQFSSAQLSSVQFSLV